jgi:soluble lytic murein transglycosylase-like protein
MTTQDRIIDAAARYGVPSNIALAVARAESGYNQAAVSGAGAIGVMQLMPATAAGLGVDPRDEGQNIDGGVRLLSQLYGRYGDWSLALAAYNAGPGNVDRYGGVPPFAETQAYVPRVLTYAGMVVPDPSQPYLPSPDGWDATPGPDLWPEYASLPTQSDNAGLWLLAAAAVLLLV